ncbi:MAG: cupin domain-containing protein [Chloroflexi bacterium]|nr:cupin domain-containing protein [Chloroflexota bacterium]
MPHVIDNPRGGERIVILQSGSQTNGQLLAFDVHLQAGAHVPAAHSHPHQEERFTVLAGRVRFRLGRTTLLAHPGTILSVPPGAAHWFGNAGPHTARLRVEVRPALRMEELLETSSNASAPGWSRLIDRALIPVDFKHELGVPFVPPRLLATLLAPLAWLRPRLST